MGRIQDTANLVYADGPSNDADEPEKSEIRDLFRIVDEDVTSAAAGMVVKVTWTELSAINGERDGQPGRVTGPDAGTHTDPVAGGTVDNEGEYAWDEGDQGWERTGDLVNVGDEMATAIGAAASKTTPVDADTVGITDSQAGGILKKLTWLNLKNSIWSSLGALIAGGTEKSTPADADTLALSSSSSGGASRKVTVKNLLAPETARGTAGIAAHSVNVGTGKAYKDGTSWVVSWTGARFLKSTEVANIADYSGTLPSGYFAYIDLTGSTPYAVQVANNDFNLRADIVAGRKMLLLWNSGAALTGSMADAIKAADAASQLSLVTTGLDLIYVGSDYEILEVDPSGEIVQGTYRDSGLPIVGGGAISGTGVITVVRDVDGLKIHLPQANTGRYVRYDLKHFIDPGNRVDIWQIAGVHNATLAGGVSTSIEDFTGGGQVEFAASRVADTGAFRIGGNAHGNDEILDDPILLIDGIEYAIDGSPRAFACDKVVIHQASQLLSPDDASNIGKRYTTWEFVDGEMILTNHVEWEAAIEFTTIYMAMMAMLKRGSGDYKGVVAPLFYPIQDLSASTSAQTTADRIQLIGKYGADVEFLEGWDKPGRESWVNHTAGSPGRNKIYFSPVGVSTSYTTTIGEVMRSKARFRLSIPL